MYYTRQLRRGAAALQLLRFVCSNVSHGMALLRLVAIKVFNSGPAKAKHHPMLILPILNAVETPNLVLREMRSADVEAFAGFMTQPRYQRFIAHRFRDQTEVSAFVDRQVATQGEMRRHVFHLAVEERHSREVVGDGFMIAHQDKTVEIGWGLHPALWRVGFGTEIGRALLGLAIERLKAKSVWCKVMKPNVASACLAKRIGFQMIETKHHYPVGHGHFEDVDVFKMGAEAYFDLPY